MDGAVKAAVISSTTRVLDFVVKLVDGLDPNGNYREFGEMTTARAGLAYSLGSVGKG